MTEEPRSLQFSAGRRKNIYRYCKLLPEYTCVMTLHSVKVPAAGTSTSFVLDVCAVNTVASIASALALSSENHRGVFAGQFVPQSDLVC